MTCPELIFSITFCQSSLWPLFSAETPFPQRWKSTFVLILFIVVVPSLSHVWFLATPWTAAHQAPLSSTLSQVLLKFMSIESLMLSISSSAALLSFCLQSFLSIRVFSNELVLCIRWPKYWSFITGFECYIFKGVFLDPWVQVRFQYHMYLWVPILFSNYIIVVPI